MKTTRTLQEVRQDMDALFEAVPVPANRDQAWFDSYWVLCREEDQAKTAERRAKRDAAKSARKAASEARTAARNQLRASGKVRPFGEGVCGVCGGTYALNKAGRLVHHGFKRPGWGDIVGDCAGVGFLPWEVSPEAAVNYMITLSRLIESRNNTIAEAEAGKRWDLFIANNVRIVIGDPRHERMFVSKIGEWKADVRHYEWQMGQYAEDVRNWKPNGKKGAK